MRILGIDYGERRIGLAISDESATIATPLSTIEYSKIDAVVNSLNKIIEEYPVKEVVVGLPLNLKGGSGSFTKKAAEFAEFLKEKLDIPVKLYDERLTSKTAERYLIDAGISRKKRKKLTDKLAAQIILQDYLICIKHSH